jgi:3-hydroxybutyryl-CoA dehydrogenase
MDTRKQQIGVIGAGIMGSGIAQTFVENDYPVVLIDIQESVLINSISKIEASLDKRGFSKHLLSYATTYDTLTDCALVIEAVPENLTLKHQVLKSIEQHISSLAILASNTSALSIEALKSVLTYPERFLGIHFMNPVIKIPLVELIPLETTKEENLQWIITLLTNMNKQTIVCRDAPGFLVNALLLPMINQSINLLHERRATAEDIDKAMTYGANFPIGPLALADLIGLDTVLSIMETLSEPSPLLITKVREGNIGRKSGKGFYTYTAR